MGLLLGWSWSVLGWTLSLLGWSWGLSGQPSGVHIPLSKTNTKQKRGDTVHQFFGPQFDRSRGLATSQFRCTPRFRCTSRGRARPAALRRWPRHVVRDILFTSGERGPEVSGGTFRGPGRGAGGIFSIQYFERNSWKTNPRPQELSDPF